MSFKVVVKNGGHGYNSTTGRYETEDIVEIFEEFTFALFEWLGWILDNSLKATLTFKPEKEA